MLAQDVSNINSIGLIFTVLMGILIIFLPRRHAIVPIIMVTCYMTFGQVLYVEGLHFTILRILLLIGWVRLIIRGEISAIKLNVIDRTLIFWVISNFAIYYLREQTSEAFVNRLGFAYNVLGTYFLFRSLIRDFDDVDRAFKVLAMAIIPLAIAMLIEEETGRNLFSFLGGVPEFSEVRLGRIRCQGPFRHPIMAGTFGATLVPLLVGMLLKRNGNKLIIFIGVIAAGIITAMAASIGPLMAFMFGIVALTLWPFRTYMRAIGWGILFTLLSLHLLIMKAPVWYLIARMGELVGGGGWHRAALIGQAIAHFDEWWLLGTNYTAHWMPYSLSANPEMADITNQFIQEGVNGGLLTMILFIILIALCFRGLGRALKIVEDRLAVGITLWSAGAALFAHVLSFISVPYFDQMIVSWYLLLAMISFPLSFPNMIRDGAPDAIRARNP
jgi:hypothetical protein